MKRILLAVIVILIVITAVIGCSNRANVNVEEYNLYFANQQMNNLVVEKRIVQEDDFEKLAEKIVEELIKGPEVASNCAVFEKDTKLLGVEIADGIANVKFNSGYLREGENANALELLARYSLVNTLCDIEGIEKVKIFINGIELTNSLGVAVGALGKEDILLNSTIAQNSNEEVLTLYFPDSNAENLVKEERKATLIDNSVEKTVVHELIKGTRDKALICTIPQATKILSVETKDGICFVNLSSDFVTAHAEGSTAETFSVYSIVNSLTELEGINSVQFLIDGKKDGELKHIVFDTPFTRNEDYITK